MKPISQNTLFYGDNLPILRDYVPDESVDLVYLDPPFNSQRAYNVSLRDKHGQEAAAQVEAFKDFWTWDAEAAAAHEDLMSVAPASVVKLMNTLKDVVGEKSAMRAYLTMMTARLLELRRVLKPSGSLYLHCDPTASHYLKIVLDVIFGPDSYQNEIIWKRTAARSDSHRWNHIHDVILFYSKSSKFTWNTQYIPYDEQYTQKFYHFVEPITGRRYASDNLTADGTRNGSSGDTWHGIDVRKKGLHWKYTIEKLEELDKEGRILWPSKQGGVPRYKRYLDEMPGLAIQSIVTDILPLSAQSAEKMGYPTQKPLALLERIIQASSNEGDVVLDPFCGCGTAVAAAQKLNRRWIGIDITHLSIALMKYRLQDNFDLEAGRDYAVIGEPQDLASASALLEEKDGRYQFQWWALSLIGARPLGGEAAGGSKTGRKGADRGIDGYLPFYESLESTQMAVVQVKSGHVQDSHLRDLLGTLETEKAPIGIFISLEAPTRAMLQTAASAGFFESKRWGKFPRLQLLTIADLLAGKKPATPPVYRQKAGRIARNEGRQTELGL